MEAVGPALLAARQAGWEQVERSYRKALGHLRGGEIDDALTAANAAVEAATSGAQGLAVFHGRRGNVRAARMVAMRRQSGGEEAADPSGLTTRR